VSREVGWNRRTFGTGTHCLPFSVPGVGDLVRDAVGELVRLDGPRASHAPRPETRLKMNLVSTDAGDGLESGTERLDIKRVRLELERLMEVAPRLDNKKRCGFGTRGRGSPSGSAVVLRRFTSSVYGGAAWSG